jgi:hypothetical protein
LPEFGVVAQALADRAVGQVRGVRVDVRDRRRQAQADHDHSPRSEALTTTYHVFRLPPDVDFDIALGVTPEPAEEGARRLEIVGEDGVTLDLTLDPLARAVSVVVTAGGRELVSIAREGATEVRLSETAPEIVITFETDDTSGKLEVSLTPAPHVDEFLLLA